MAVIKKIKIGGVTYDLPSGGGGGAVSSVNGKTGTVELNASDVGAATTSDITSAIDALDVTTSGAGASKTLTALSQTDGKISATFGNISITKSQVSDFPTIPTVNNGKLTIQKNGTQVAEFTANQSGNTTANITIPTITDTYSGTSSDGMSGKAVKSAIDALDVTTTGASASKTITALSQTDGKISATFGDISITKSQVSDFPTIPTVNNGTLTIQKNGTQVTTFTANQSSNATANITVPTKTSDLTNNSNYVSDASYVHTDNNYTSADKTKLNGIESGAEVNQNAFSAIYVNGLSIAAATKTDSFELKEGTNVTLEINNIDRFIRINATNSSVFGGEVLWTNPNGFTGTFVAQYIDVGVNLANYRWYEITFNVTDSASNPKASSTGLIPVGSGCNLQRTGGTYLISRGLDAPTIVMTSSGTATRFNFTACTRVNSYGASGSTNYNQLCIPYQIIGYK